MPCQTAGRRDAETFFILVNSFDLIKCTWNCGDACHADQQICCPRETSYIIQATKGLEVFVLLILLRNNILYCLRIECSRPVHQTEYQASQSKMRRFPGTVAIATSLLILTIALRPIDAIANNFARHQQPAQSYSDSALEAVVSPALDKLVAEVWLRSRTQLQFCFGRSQQHAEDLIRASFAVPPPSAGGDGICSSTARIDEHLCSPEAILVYYKVMSFPVDRKLPPIAMQAYLIIYLSVQIYK